MNLSSIFWEDVEFIADSQYRQRACKEYKSGEGFKQQIPTMKRAVEYANEHDIDYNIAYHKDVTHEKYKHPHYTAAYYCPWCDCYHLTTSPDVSNLQEEVEYRCRKAKAQGNSLDRYPMSGRLAIKLWFPEYMPEERERRDRENQLRGELNNAEE